mmetsp:Transcript_46055/g.100032  ORF Transcript_46055/g.100032 Transcript_46055/m.100032 type:complete len:177 (-) Transcript_46055:126-656(-)
MPLLRHRWSLAVLWLSALSLATRESIDSATCDSCDVSSPPLTLIQRDASVFSGPGEDRSLEALSLKQGAMRKASRSGRKQASHSGQKAASRKGIGEEVKQPQQPREVLGKSAQERSVAMLQTLQDGAHKLSELSEGTLHDAEHYRKARNIATAIRSSPFLSEVFLASLDEISAPSS